jgi:hypothetical protein
MTADEFFALSIEEIAALPPEAYADMTPDDLVIVSHELVARMQETAKHAIERRAKARAEVRHLEELWDR